MNVKSPKDFVVLNDEDAFLTLALFYAKLTNQEWLSLCYFGVLFGMFEKCASLEAQLLRTTFQSEIWLIHLYTDSTIK